MSGEWDGEGDEIIRQTRVFASGCTSRHPAGAVWEARCVLLCAPMQVRCPSRLGFSSRPHRSRPRFLALLFAGVWPRMHGRTSPARFLEHHARREYLLQLMMAQESGLLPGSTAAAAAHHVLAQQHAQHAAQQQAVAAAAAMPGPPQRQSSGHLDLAGLGSGAGSRIKTPTRTSAPAIPTVTSPEHMLMNLQEALANVSLSVDGLSAVSGAPHIGAGRTSDPGLGPAGLHMAAHAISAVHPLPHMNRISDSGQTLGLASPKGLTLESLLPLVNSLAAQQKAAQQAQAQAQAHAVAAAQQMVRQASFGAVGSPPRSPPPPARSSTPGTSTPGSSCDGLTAAVQHVTGAAAAAAAAGSPVSSPQARMQPASPMPSQTQAQALQVLQAAAAVAASSPGINPAYVNKIMGELQEQGLAGGWLRAVRAVVGLEGGGAWRAGVVALFIEEDSSSAPGRHVLTARHR